jgi:hypothetical protein
VLERADRVIGAGDRTVLVVEIRIGAVEIGRIAVAGSSRVDEPQRLRQTSRNIEPGAAGEVARGQRGGCGGIVRAACVTGERALQARITRMIGIEAVRADKTACSAVLRIKRKIERDRIRYSLLKIIFGGNYGALIGLTDVAGIGVDENQAAAGQTHGLHAGREASLGRRRRRRQASHRRRGGTDVPDTTAGRISASRGDRPDEIRCNTAINRRPFRKPGSAGSHPRGIAPFIRCQRRAELHWVTQR